MTTIHIDVKHGEITCGTKGGHLRVPHGSTLTWTSKGPDKKFVLEFFELEVETSGATRKLVHWPFDKPAAPPAGPTNEFTGTLKTLPKNATYAPIYKYNVRIGDLLLDPIIIVDR